MSTVFLSGSRKISRINDAVRGRLGTMATNQLSIVIGDANGADRAMQSYLAEIGYRDVTVYFAGEVCRNNLGAWDARSVAVNPELTGREFYVQKDREMARVADFGFVLWDGKSAGAIQNIVELIKLEKKVVVYFSPEKSFYNLHTGADIDHLLKRCEPAAIDLISRKIRLSAALREIKDKMQATLPL